MTFSTIPQAIKSVRKGEMLIVVDDPKRENEGDFFIPAERATPRAIAMMLKLGSGVLCVSMTRERQKRLRLPLMVKHRDNAEKTGVRFTVGFSASAGVTTGVSAYDRARTIRLTASPRAKAKDFTRPGHVLGLVAARRGLKERRGHTEAAVALAEIAGFEPVGVLCEIVRDDGRMARLPDLKKLSKKLGVHIIALKDLISYVENK